MEKQDEIITTAINANSPDQKNVKETENVQKEESIVDERTDKAAIASYPIYSEVSNGTDQNLEKASTFRQVKENISNFFSGIFLGIKKFFKKLKDKLNKKSKKEVTENQTKEIVGVIEVPDEGNEVENNTEMTKEEIDM